MSKMCWIDWDVLDKNNNLAKFEMSYRDQDIYFYILVDMNTMEFLPTTHKTIWVEKDPESYIHELVDLEDTEFEYDIQFEYFMEDEYLKECIIREIEEDKKEAV